MIVTAFTLAERYVGVHELRGAGEDHPLIRWWLEEYLTEVELG